MSRALNRNRKVTGMTTNREENLKVFVNNFAGRRPTRYVEMYVYREKTFDLPKVNVLVICTLIQVYLVSNLFHLSAGGGHL